MGYRTVILLNNDRLDYIRSDPHGFADAVARTAGSGRGAVFHHYGIQITDPAHSSADQLYFASHTLLVDMGQVALEMPEATGAAARSALDRIRSARRTLDIVEAAANKRLAELEPEGPLT